MSARKKKAAPKRKVAGKISQREVDHEVAGFAEHRRQQRRTAPGTTGRMLENIQRSVEEGILRGVAAATDKVLAKLINPPVIANALVQIAMPFLVPPGCVEIPGEILADYGEAARATRGTPQGPPSAEFPLGKPAIDGSPAIPGGVLFQSHVADDATAVVVAKDIVDIRPREVGVRCTLVMREDQAKEAGLVPL